MTKNRLSFALTAMRKKTGGVQKIRRAKGSTTTRSPSSMSIFPLSKTLSSNLR